MPQMGLHMCVGIELGRSWQRTSRSFRLGLLCGSILPDLDFIPLIALRFYDRELAVSFHRNLTHSFLGMGMFSVLLFAAAFLAGRTGPSRLASGLALGMLVHAILDVFLWFSSVHITWPWGEPINLYAGRHIPDWVSNLTLVGEPAAYVLFLVYLRRACGVQLPARSRIMFWVMAVSSLILLALFPFFSRHTFEVMAYGVSIPLGFLPAVALLIVLRNKLLGPPM